MMTKYPILLTLLLISIIACNAIEPTPTPTRSDSRTFANPVPLAYSENGLDLVFQGGGAKGLAHIGAIRELERQNIPYRRLVGTSAGNIMAVLLAAGFSADEIEAVTTERTADGNIVMGSLLAPPDKDEFDAEQLRNSVTYLSLQDILPDYLPQAAADEIDIEAMDTLLDNPNYRGLFAIVETGGLYSGRRLIEWLSMQLDKENQALGKATQAQFYQETGADLTIVATDATDGVMLMLNHRTAPNLPVVWAVRMSSSIPFVFQEVTWRPEWGLYQGKDISGHMLVDGGATTNLPLELVLSQDPAILAAMELEPDPERVLGLVLDHDSPVAGLELLPTPVATEDIDTVENERIAARWLEIEKRTLDLVDTLLNAHDHLLAATYPEHVCNLPVQGVETLEYDMGDEKIARLLAAAEAEVRVCLKEMEEE